MKIGSLFSGYGGLDLAVEAIFNAQPAWFCEFDKAPSKVLAHHWPDVPNHKDVTQINWKEVEPVDILTGGSPCQDLSQAGKRAGMTEGTRSNLWVNMREAIAALQPKYVVWENVLGALSATATSDSDMEQGGGLLAAPGGGHLRALGRVLGDLTEIGYDAKWTTLRASDIGAPHHRARVFLIAQRSVLNTGHDAGRPEHGKQYETPTSGAGEPSCGIATDTGSIRLQTFGRYAVPSAPEITWDNSSISSLPDTISIRQYGRGTAPEQTQGTHGATDRHSSGIEWGKYAPAVRRWERITRPAPAPTELNTRGKPRLNAEFAEWLMGLSAGWVTDPAIGLTRSQQLKALGNGVVPQQSAYALQHLLTT